MVRCTNAATVVAVAAVETDAGPSGCMSLCDDCKKVMKKQLGKDYATFRPAGKWFKLMEKLIGEEAVEKFFLVQPTEVIMGKLVKVEKKFDKKGK